MPKISILITCHNRKDKTLMCLDALYKSKIQNRYTFDVFLVDDGSSDGTSEAVLANYSSVNIIQGNGNLYWNRGMYLAWKTAIERFNYDYYLWLNDDTFLFIDAIYLLIETSLFYNNKSIIVGSTIDECSNISYGGRDSSGKIISDNFKKECDYFNGNIVLIPRYVYKSVGLIDPTFQHSLGDFDYGFRAKKLSIKIYTAPKVLGICNGQKKIPQWCNPENSFRERWTVFRTPLGQNPEEFFIYELRHNGLFQAIFHYITNHLRVMFPNIWIRKK